MFDVVKVCLGYYCVISQAKCLTSVWFHAISQINSCRYDLGYCNVTFLGVLQYHNLLQSVSDFSMQESMKYTVRVREICCNIATSQAPAKCVNLIDFSLKTKTSYRPVNWIVLDFLKAFGTTISLCKCKYNYRPAFLICYPL